MSLADRQIYFNKILKGIDDILIGSLVGSRPIILATNINTPVADLKYFVAPEDLTLAQRTDFINSQANKIKDDSVYLDLVYNNPYLMDAIVNSASAIDTLKSTASGRSRLLLSLIGLSKVFSNTTIRNKLIDDSTFFSELMNASPAFMEWLKYPAGIQRALGLIPQRTSLLKSPAVMSFWADVNSENFCNYGATKLQNWGSGAGTIVTNADGHTGRGKAYYAYMTSMSEYPNVVEFGISQDLDLTGVSTLVLYVKQNASSSRPFQVLVGSTQVYSDTTPRSDWYRASINVSSYSGNRNVKARMYTNQTTQLHLYLSGFQLI